MSEHSQGRINAEVLNALGSSGETLTAKEVTATVNDVLPGVSMAEVFTSLVSMQHDTIVHTELIRGLGWRKVADPDPRTFTLTVELGNDAMQTQGDLTTALRNALTSFYGFESDADTTFESNDGGPILDLNGNRVGEWVVQ